MIAIPNLMGVILCSFFLCLSRSSVTQADYWHKRI